MKALLALALLPALAWALPAEAQDGTKFSAARWDLVDTVELKETGGGVQITASGPWQRISASVTGPDGTARGLDLDRRDGRFVLEAFAPGGPWSADGLHTIAFEGQGARDEVPVEMAGGALAPGFGSASRSGDTVTFRTWTMIVSATVESRGGADAVKVDARTARTAQVTVSLLSPGGASSVLEAIEPDGRYSFAAPVGGPLWSQDGDYTLLFEQPGSPPYRDDLILPVSGGSVALPVEPFESETRTSAARWSEIQSASMSAESLSVRGSSERPLKISLISPGGVLVPLGQLAPDGDFSAVYDVSGSTGEPGAYVVQFGEPGDELVAYLGIRGAPRVFEAERWAMIESAEALSGRQNTVELRGSTDRAAPVSVVRAGPDGTSTKLPPAVPDGGEFSVSVPVDGWKDGMHALVLEQPGSPPYRDVHAVSVESGEPVATVRAADVKASGARWTAVESASVSGSAVSVRGSSDSDLRARASLPDGRLADLGPVRAEGGSIALELDASEEPWNGSGAYALILEGPGVRDVVPLLMDGGQAAPGFGLGGDASLEAWKIIQSASVQRKGGSDVLIVRGSAPAGGPVSVSVSPPGAPPVPLETVVADGGAFTVEAQVGGSAWERDGVYEVIFEQGSPPATDRLYLDVRGGSVVPEFGAAFAVLAAAAGGGLAARRLA